MYSMYSMNLGSALDVIENHQLEAHVKQLETDKVQ